MACHIASYLENRRVYGCELLSRVFNQLCHHHRKAVSTWSRTSSSRTKDALIPLFTVSLRATVSQETHVHPTPCLLLAPKWTRASSENNNNNRSRIYLPHTISTWHPDSRTRNVSLHCATCWRALYVPVAHKTRRSRSFLESPSLPTSSLSTPGRLRGCLGEICIKTHQQQPKHIRRRRFAILSLVPLRKSKSRAESRYARHLFVGSHPACDLPRIPK